MAAIKSITTLDVNQVSASDLNAVAAFLLASLGSLGDVECDYEWTCATMELCIVLLKNDFARGVLLEQLGNILKPLHSVRALSLYLANFIT